MSAVFLMKESEADGTSSDRWELQFGNKLKQGIYAESEHL
jgi:hypothetical protein